MNVNRKNRYFSLADKNGRPVGTMWYATTVSKKDTGDFYITTYARDPALEVDYQPIYFSLHLPKPKHESPKFFLRLPKENIRRSGLEVATSFPFEEGQEIPFLGERIDEECWRVVRLTWSYRLQQEKFGSIALSRYVSPILEEPNDGFALREELPLNSYWKIDFFLSKNTPYKLPGEALGLASSVNDYEAITHLRSNSLGEKYFLTSVSSMSSGLRRPVPEYCQAPASLKADATMITRMAIHDSGFYWVHETITSKKFKEQLQNSSRFSLVTR